MNRCLRFNSRRAIVGGPGARSLPTVSPAPVAAARDVSAVLAVLTVLFVASIGACTAGGEWNEFRGPGGAGGSAASMSAPIGIRLQLRLQPRFGDERFFNQPVIVGDTAYFGSSDGNFYALDLESGFMRWTFRTGGPINSVAYASGGSIYFGSSDGILYALDRETGEERWRFETAGQLNSTIVPWNGFIVAAADADSFYVVTEDGELVFTIPNPVWIHNSFQINGDDLCFAPGTGEYASRLSVYDLSSRAPRWYLAENPSTYFWFSFPVVSSDALAYSAVRVPYGYGRDRPLEFILQSLDRRDGSPRWTVTGTGLLTQEDEDPGIILSENSQLLDYAAPLVWRDRIIFTPGDRTLRAYSAATGDELWAAVFPAPLATPPTLAGDRLFFGLRAEDREADSGTEEGSTAAGGASDGVPAGTGALVCVSAADGREYWSIRIEGTILNSPVVAGARIVFATDAGYFYVLEEMLF